MIGLLEILYALGTGIVAVLLWMLVKSFIRRQLREKLSKNITTGNSSIGKTYKVDRFRWDKFKDNFSLGSGRKWGKVLSDIFDARKWVIRILIFLIAFGAYSYWQGRIQAPAQFNWDYEKEITLKVARGSVLLHKPANSAEAYWVSENGRKTKVKVGDIKEIKDLLKPIGFELKPIIVAGVGLGERGAGFEGGAGIRFLRFFKQRAEAFITNRGIYLGTSYQFTDHSGVGLAAGRGFAGDSRMMLYWVTRF
ncbi:hypothetical protein LCGC14_0305530 [marine sediment metagenome]|uniref:Uncharacterized protein n=1 Tax=marine sediment metagenome TaxID=412755 RepID=A0A0F9TTQ5_9ZZZZ